MAEVPSQLPEQSRIEHARMVGGVVDTGFDQRGHAKELHPPAEQRSRRRPGDDRNCDAEATGRIRVPVNPVRCIGRGDANAHRERAGCRRGRQSALHFLRPMKKPISAVNLLQAFHVLGVSVCDFHGQQIAPLK
jgi:hypothetical protein